jgi:purine catabolism regulator
MGITVAQALKIGGLGQGRVLAGAQNLDNVIEYVNIVEARCEAYWMIEKALFLTTFYAIRDDVQAQVDTIEMLAERQCAGLVFQKGVLSNLAPAVIQRADEVGLPLIEIPQSAQYPEILGPLTGAILQERTFLLQRSQEIHRRLTGLILSGGGLAEIASALSALIRHPVAITDAWGSVMAATDFDHIGDALADTLAGIPKVKWEWHSEPLWDAAQRVWLTPVLAGPQETVDGFVVVRDPAGQLDRLDLTAVEQAATIAALEVAKQKSVQEAERRLKRDFVEDLLGGAYHSVEAISARARSLGWELLHKRAVMVVDLDKFEQYYLTHREWREERFQQVKEWLLHATGEVVSECNPQSILVDRSDSVILLPHFEPGTPPSMARRGIEGLAKAICQRAQEQLDELSITVAIGGLCDSVEGLRDSYREAKAALNVARKIARHRPIIWYNDVALYVLLDRLATEPETRRWFEHNLGPLVEYDRNKGTELVRTLETYFDVNQMQQQTAHQLGIHLNTLKYRLRRIEEILGTDPFLGDRQLSFYLATKLAHLL